MIEEEKATEELEPTEEAPPALPKRPSGAQRRRDNRPRFLRDGVWSLNIWQPHPRVLRGKRKENDLA